MLTFPETNFGNPEVLRRIMATRNGGLHYQSNNHNNENSASSSPNLNEAFGDKHFRKIDRQQSEFFTTKPQREEQSDVSDRKLPRPPSMHFASHQLETSKYSLLDSNATSMSASTESLVEIARDEPVFVSDCRGNLFYGNSKFCCVGADSLPNIHKELLKEQFKLRQEPKSCVNLTQSCS